MDRKPPGQQSPLWAAYLRLALTVISALAIIYFIYLGHKLDLENERLRGEIVQVHLENLQVMGWVPDMMEWASILDRARCRQSALIPRMESQGWYREMREVMNEKQSD